MSTDYKNDYYELVKPNYKAFEVNLPEYWEMKYGDRYEILKKLLRKDKFSILDVGCGSGRGLSYYEKLGVNGTGVEPSDYGQENKMCLGEIIQGEFLEVEIKDKYDVVNFEQVLSHMTFYYEALKKAKSLLTPGGILVIEEPNEFNPLQMIIAKQRGQYWITPDHSTYLNFTQMEAILKDLSMTNGLKTCTYPMELFELMGEYYIGDEEAGRGVHRKRYELLKNLGFENRQNLLSKFMELGWGRDQVYYLRGN